MARERIPNGEVLQAAYGVFDKHKMNRTFFVKTEQTDCETLPPPIEAIDPTTEATITEEKEDSENETDSDENYEISIEDELTTVKA